MLTEDYLMRMINLAVAALLRAIGLRKEGQYLEAQQAIDQALEQLTGLRADLLAHLSDQALVDSITVQGELDRERALLLAEIYQEQGEIEQGQGYRELACTSRARALALCLEAALSDPDGLLLSEKVDEILASTQDCVLPFETRFTLYSYFDFTGGYSRAEQTLASLINESQYAEEMRQEYQEFCHRLLKLPGSELEQGGLSHRQVEDFLLIHAKPGHASL